MSNLAHTLFPREAARHIRVASALPQSLTEPGWRLSYLSGKLVELRSGVAAAGLTAGLRMVQRAQEAGETAVWVTSTESIFFSGDAAEGGLDLEALVVVRVSGALALLRVVDKLARSGGFGIIVLDLVSLFLPFSVSLSHQSRLLGLAQKHQAAMIFLTRDERPFSVAGSLISLRVQVERRLLETDFYEVDVEALKDKQSGPGWHHAEFCRGPAGLC